MTTRVFHIIGKVLDRKTRRGFSGLRIEAWDKDCVYDDQIGSAVTDTRGAFSITFSEASFRVCFGDRRPDLYFKVFRGAELIQSTEDSILWNVEAATIPVAIEVDIPAVPQPTPDDDVDLIGHRITGQLLDQKTDKPLPRMIVHAFDLDAGPEPKDLGYDLTDAKGLFTVTYTTKRPPRKPRKTTSRRRLRLHMLDRQRQEIHRTEIRTHADPRQIVEVRVPIPAVPEPPSPPLKEVAQKSKLKIPKPLLDTLAQSGIRTLTDVRRQGGLGHLHDLPISADDPAVQLLDAHANLSMISSDIELNDRLIVDKGFKSIGAIARAPREKFVAAAYEEAGHFKAAQMHVKAKAQTRFLSNVLMGLKADWANGLPVRIPGITNPHIPQWFKRICDCDDCESAVSPQAYLADLLDYSVQHLRDDDEPIDIEFLADTFHQPFAELSTSCEASQEQIRQVRICIEVLRAYRHGAQLVAQEKLRNYCLAAYTDLLTRLGTSYQELRLVRNPDDKKHKALAERLGIRATHLNGLRLDPEEIDEGDLERLFGLRHTNRNPWEDTPGPSPIETWRLEFLRDVWRRQDWPQDSYVEAVEPDAAAELLPVIDPDLVGPDDFRHPQPKLNANDPDQPFDIWLNRRRWVDDRLAEFGLLVNQQGVRDVQTLLDRMDDPLPEYLEIVPWASVPTSEQLEQILQDVSAGVKQKVEEATSTIEGELHLTVASFTRLMAIRARYQQIQVGISNETVSDEEWRELFSILVQAQKVAVFPAWLQDEREWRTDHNVKTLLGPRDFWFSLRESGEGDWPPLKPVADRPWIDPDVVTLEDLPEPTIGQRAVEIWRQRRTAIDDHISELRVARNQDGTGFDQIVQGDLQQTPERLAELETDLDSGDPERVQTATHEIETALHLTVEDFRHLRELGAKSDRITSDDWEEVYTILTRAVKERDWIPGWFDVENNEPVLGWFEIERNEGLNADELQVGEYWRALKARLPRWRASAEARQQWQQALRVRSQSPIIDPDVIDTGRLKYPFNGPARDLCRARKEWVDSRLGTRDRQGEIEATHLDAGFNEILKDSLGVEASTLADIQQQGEDGADITARVEQLSLTLEAFRYLLRIRDLAEIDANGILPSEWKDTYSILFQVEKRRRFAEWKKEEQDEDIILGPDQFKSPEPPPLQFPPPEPAPLPAWRATFRDLRDWDQRLQSRIDQQQAVIDGLHSLVSNTEATCLPLLRDHLIDAINVAHVNGAAAKAKWLTDHLLIDARAGGCQMTTRVAQAIETLQGVLWSVRTGQLNDTYPELTLNAPDFDEEWKWIGSYATWRAAMFVFIFPENILHPSLLQHQTPAFRRLVNDLRGAGGRLAPELACGIAASYYDYFEDVCNLTLEASHEALTRIHRGRGCHRETGGFSNLWYFFARPRHKTKVYWSSYDYKDGSGYALSFWDAVPGLDHVIVIIGAQPYNLSPEERFLYVFVKTDHAGQQKLMFSRYDLENQAWEGEPKELELPEATEDFQAAVIRRNLKNQAPWLRIRVGDLFYERQLNGEGSAWADDDWQPLDRLWGSWRVVTGHGAPAIPSGAQISALRQSGGPIHLFVIGGDGQIYTSSSTADGDWQSWSSVGTEVFQSGARVTAVARGADHVDLFAVREGAVWWNHREDEHDWDGWRQLHAQTPHSLLEPEEPLNSFDDDAIVIAVARSAEHIELYLVGTVSEDGAPLIYTTDWDASPRNLPEDFNNWDYWREVGNKRVEHGTEIAAIKTSPRYIPLFVHRRDGGVWTNLWNSENETGPWYRITSDEDAFPEKSIVTAFLRGNYIEIFAVDADGSVKRTTSAKPEDSDSWDAWSAISDSEHVEFPPGAALAKTQRAGNHANLFALSVGGAVYGTWSDPNYNDGDWNPWLPIGLASPTTSRQRLEAVKFGGEIHLFILGSDRRIYHNASHGWIDIDPITVNLPEGYRYNPRVAEPFAVTAPNSEARLQQLRGLVREAFEDNDPSPDLIPRPLWNLVYLEEAYYFVPIQVAMQLQAAGQYIAALDWFRTVYDYSVDPDVDEDGDHRKISRVLSRDDSQEEAEFDRADDWLLDPLDPHGIALTRPGTYTRFTLMALVRCFLEYADAEFTRDTAESVPRARVLYTTALELLDLPELKHRQGCDDPREWLPDDLVDDNHWRPAWEDILGDLYGINDAFSRFEGIREVMNVMRGGDPALEEGLLPPLEDRLAEARGVVDQALANRPSRPTFGEVVAEKAASLDTAYTALLGHENVAKGADRAGAIAGGKFVHAVSLVAGISPGTLLGEKVDIPWLGQPMIGHAGGGGPGLAPGSDGMEAPIWTEYERWTRLDPFAPSRMAILAKMARKAPWDYLPENGYQPDPWSGFCVPRNPVLEALRLHAELNLYKLRTCRNIAGMERQLEPYAAPTDTISGLPMIGAGGQLILPGTVSLQPTQYRYSVLIERAKQLVQLAAQIEAAMLSALEKHDAEAYTVLKARQDISLARAGVTLQELRVREAEGGVTLAELQKDRAQIQIDQYTEWLDEGTSIWEELVLISLAASAALHLGAAIGVPLGPNAAAEKLSSLAAAASAAASAFQAYAAYERRREEWEFQKSLAEQEVRIGAQQITLAEDHVRMTGQERLIAKMQAQHSNETLDFLTNKFTNVELYDWMSNVLEGVYSFFLQRATAMAKLAENQLAFERQEAPVSFIQADYWEAPSDTSIGPRSDSRGPDRRGLTGSARLLQDIYQLDQHAFETNKRKLQLSKTISLARMAPFEFQLFRETGVLTLRTPMELFDRDFPGHHLRLIHKVRTSVIALIPPTEGIRATLSTTGLSRVVIGPEVFQTVVVRRAPESVALSSPNNAIGVFELEAQSEMLLPFEGMGVDTTWEFRMPKASNQFNYRTIADVLITIEYTALQSFDYQQQVIQTLSPAFGADRPFSFRHQFADQWYDLHNPDQTATPMTVIFKTIREDFAPNLDNLKIDHVVLYFARASAQPSELPVTSLRFVEEGGAGFTGGEATPIEGVISTRRGNAGSWTAMIGKSPTGIWELALPDTQEIRALFKNKAIEDILFVITYSGRTPEWPT